LLLNYQQLVCQVSLKAGGGKFTPFTPGCLLPGSPQIVPGRYPVHGDAAGGVTVHEEMIVLTRTYDLLNWLVPKAERFPRVFRQTVVARLIDAALDLQESLLLAERARGRERSALLRESDQHLDRLRLYLRLAHDWQWLSHGQLSRMTLEIGRLLGGWIKQHQKS
jgi:ABC-type uncharacterized transport system ATPase subunit